MAVADRATPGASRGLRAALGLLLAALVCLAFRPVFGAQLLNWDDDANLLDNPHFRGLSGEHLEWMFTTPSGGPYMPLTWLSLALDHAVHGLGEGFEQPEAAGYHATNVLLHALGAVLFIGLATRLLRAARGAPATPRAARDSALFGFLAAALFALHPLRVESVAWITERRDVLSGVFFVLAVRTYLDLPPGPVRLAPRAGLTAALAAAAAVALFFASVELGGERLAAGALGLPGLALALVALGVATASAGRAAGPRAGPANGRRALSLSVAWLTLALLSKALGVTLPLVLLALDLWPLGRWKPADGLRPALALALEKAPYFALALVFGLIAVWGQGRYEAMLTLEAHPLAQRCAQAVYGLWFYPTRTLLPFGLIPLVELPPHGWVSSARFLLPACGVAALVLAAFLSRRRAPALAVALVAFALLIAPVLGFSQAGAHLVADRYSYVACMPFAPLVATPFLLLTERRPDMVRAVSLGAVLLLGALAIATHRQTARWHDTETLWTHQLAVAPESVRPHYMLGRMHYRAAQDGGGRAALERAREEFERGIAKEPRVHPYYHGIYGALLIDLGRFAEAARILAQVVGEEPEDPRHLTNLGVALRQLGRVAEAREAAERAVRADPDYVKGWVQLAVVREAAGDPEAAAQAWRRVLDTWPRYQPARRKLRELEGRRE